MSITQAYVSKLPSDCVGEQSWREHFRQYFRLAWSVGHLAALALHEQMILNLYTLLTSDIVLSILISSQSVTYLHLWMA